MREPSSTAEASWPGVPRPWRDAGFHAALGLAGAAFGVAGWWNVFSILPEPVSPWWTLATALPACLLLFTQRRAPALSLAAASALLVVDVLTVGGIVTTSVVLDLLYTLVVTATPELRRRLLTGVIVTTIGTTVAAGVLSRDVSLAFLIALQTGALLGTDYWYATAVAQSRELVELHRRRAEDAARLARRDRAAVVTAERESVARELHDLVAGHVAAIAIRSEAALAIAGDDTTDRLALRAVRDASLDAHAALRSMITVLRSGSDESPAPPSRADVTALAEEARRSGLRVTLADTLDGAIPVPVDHAVGRIVQESLANCIRHAAGAHVDVRLEGVGRDVLVSVRSRGGTPAVPALTGNGIGLDLLRERTGALGGDVEAGPRDDGWLVHARIPRENVS